jgi:ribonuclease VapC
MTSAVANAVLDASAALADLHHEPGGDVARAAAPTSVMSAVNFAEVVSQMILHGVPPQEAETLTYQLRFEVLDVDQRAASVAGAIHARTRRWGASLADAFCLALAQDLGVPALTTDRVWATLGLDVDVRLIR